jgi:hypothetical protein
MGTRTRTEERGFGARLDTNSAITVEGTPMRPPMRLLIDIATAALIVVCITASSGAFAAGRTGRSADGLSCAVSLPQNTTPAMRCAAIKRQCGGKFYASACGDKLLSAVN